MADVLKILAQVNPVAQTLTDAYTVPASTSATLSSVVICNQGSSDAKFRIAVAAAGAADTTKQYLYYDYTVPAYSTFVATIGITLATTDVVRVYTDGSSVSFNIFGVQV